MVDFSYYQCLGLTMVWNWEVGNWSSISASTGPQVMLPHAWAFVASNHPSVLKLQQASLPEPSTWKVPLILQNPAQMSPSLKDFSECLRERSHFWFFAPRLLTITAVSFVPLHCICIIPACRTISYSSLCTWSLKQLLIHSMPPVYPRWVGEGKKMDKEPVDSSTAVNECLKFLS